MLIENKDLGKESTIQISEDLCNVLRDLGVKGESYQDIIWRLVTKRRRPGTLHNKKELKEKYDGEFDEGIDEYLLNFQYKLQDLEQELDVDIEEIHTSEIRSILVGIEQICDELDDLPLDKK